MVWYTLIRGAQRLPADTTEERIATVLPNKDSLVVVYCAGEDCPASQHLAKRLIDAGYKNVLDYHGGFGTGSLTISQQKRKKLECH